MPLNAEQRAARARLAALTRHHGDQADLPDDAAEIQRTARQRRIAELVAAAPKMTGEQRELLARIFQYGEPENAAG